MFAQDWKELLFSTSRNGVVMPLIYAGFDIALLLAYINILLHLRRGEVGESKFLEFALLMSVIHCLCCIFKGRLAIRDVQEHGFHS